MKHTSNRIITLDFEASGIGENSYPIEVGVSLTDGSTWCTLIKPLSSWQHWDSSAEKVHGISQEDLSLNGKAPLFVAKQLNNLLENMIVYSDCVVLDAIWLRKLYDAANIHLRFKLVDMMYIMDEERYDKLLATKKAIAKNLQLDRHRASNDALILQMAYQELY